MKLNKQQLDNVDKLTGELLPRIKTQLTAQSYPKQYEQNHGKSLTVPNQSMTIKEMVARHRKGLPIDESRGALYQGDELVADISQMDLIDRQQYIDSVADALVEVKERLREAAKSKSEKELIDRVEFEVQKRIKELQQNSKKTITDIESE